MCGIVGVHGTIQGAIRDSLELAAREIQHRGPDFTGLHVGQRFAVAHTRLSILDLSEAGNQPFADGRYALAYNGEIYNYQELRRELEGDGLAVRGTSDTATLFAYLRRHGVERTLERIRGMFAFVWADTLEDSVWLCRDRFGIKPLYYSSQNGGLYFASEVKAIRKLLPIRPDPIRTLHALASAGEASAEYTVFESVYQVPPGGVVERKGDGTPRIWRYHDVCQEVDEQEYRRLARASFADVCQEFRELLTASVKRMLMSDAPMGAFVSGGVDSSLIAAVANRNGAPVQLFTSDVQGRLSEVEDARVLGRSLPAPLREAPFAPDDLLKTLAWVTWHYECPVVTHSNAAPLALVAREARRAGVKAVLTGEGADELFLGYPKMAATLLKPYLRLPLTILERTYGLVPKLRDFILGTKGVTAVDFVHQMARGMEPNRVRLEAERAFSFLEVRERRWSVWSVEGVRIHLLTLLHRNDRMGMSGSIEARFPYLDERVVRFGLNLPRKHKMRWVLRLHDIKHPFLEDKAPVRAMAREHLPERLSAKRKQGFPIFGLQYVQTRPGAFEGGWVAQTLGLREHEIRDVCETADRYMVGKLLAVDVFGRLFGLGEDIASIERRLEAHCSVRL